MSITFAERDDVYGLNQDGEKRRHLLVLVSSEMRRDLKMRCVAENITMQAAIREGIRRMLEIPDWEADLNALEARELEKLKDKQRKQKKKNLSVA